MPLQNTSTVNALPAHLVELLDALRFTTPTNLSAQPQAFEAAVEQLVPLGLVERHGPWRFTLSDAGIQALLGAQMQSLFDKVETVAAKERVQASVPPAHPRSMWTDRLVHLARREWRGAANKSAGTTPDQCMFKAACLALLALVHEGAQLGELRLQWVGEVEARCNDERLDTPLTTRFPVDWGTGVSFAAAQWRTRSIDFHSAMLRASALAFLGWFHLRRTRWSLPAGHGLPSPRRRKRAART